MNLVLVRTTYTADSTLGVLLINGERFCVTLEDVVRDRGAPKVYAKTAIPAGRYKVIVNLSKRFKRLMPLLLSVPGFEGVRIHGGNNELDTAGCILVAKNVVDDRTIQGSMSAAVTEKLRLSTEDNHLEIVDTFPYKGV